MIDSPQMGVGVQLPEIEWRASWPEYRDMALAAEAVGFDSVWLGDHLLYDTPKGPLGPWEAWTQLAALSAVTERVLLGPLVSPTGFRGPALLVKMASTVDEISAGRLILGLGSGWNQREFEAYDIPFDRRVSRFEEAFAIIRGLIRDGQVDFEGEFYKAPNTVLAPPVRPDLPIMIGSSGPRTLEIAAPNMDWWNEWWAAFGNVPEGLDPFIERVDRALTAVGREPSSIVKSVALMVQLPDGRGRITGSKRPAQPITGSVAEIADQILAFSSRVDHVQLVVDPITRASIESLGPVVEKVHRG